MRHHRRMFATHVQQMLGLKTQLPVFKAWSGQSEVKWQQIYEPTIAEVQEGQQIFYKGISSEKERNSSRNRKYCVVMTTIRSEGGG